MRRNSDKWRVTLFNKHAMCGIGGTGRTRRAAFYGAYNRAGAEFRHLKLSEPSYYGSKKGTDVMWLACFNEALASMRAGYASNSMRYNNGMEVEIRRLVEVGS